MPFQLFHAPHHSLFQLSDLHSLLELRCVWFHATSPVSLSRKVQSPSTHDPALVDISSYHTVVQIGRC